MLVNSKVWHPDRIASLLIVSVMWLRLILVGGSVVDWSMREGVNGVMLSDVFRNVFLGGVLFRVLFWDECYSMFNVIWV